MLVHLMGVGNFVGMDDIHLAVSGHDLNPHAGEFVQNVQNGGGGLLTVQGCAMQH